MSANAKLKELGIKLPVLSAPSGAYVPAVRCGNILFLSGQVTRVNGVVQYAGKVGGDISLDEAYKAAEICALNSLAAIVHEAGDLDKVERIVKLTGFINVAPGFKENPKVLNGASDLLLNIFGEKGRHARSAIGVAGLPDEAPCEVEMIVQLKADDASR